MAPEAQTSGVPYSCILSDLVPGAMTAPDNAGDVCRAMDMAWETLVLFLAVGGCHLNVPLSASPMGGPREALRQTSVNVPRVLVPSQRAWQFCDLSCDSHDR